MGGAELSDGRRVQSLRRFGGLLVSGPDSGSNLGPCCNFRSGDENHEKARDIRSAQREGGIGVAVC